jgi:hypothetical protein
MSLLLNLVAGGLTGVGVLLTGLGGRGFVRHADGRSFLLLLGFGCFLAQGVLLTWALTTRGSLEDLVVPIVALSAVALVCIYGATLVRHRA